MKRLADAMRAAGGRVEVKLRGGNRVKLGEQIIFEVTSSAGGRLILVDVNAKGEVTQIFPNRFLTNEQIARIAKDAPVSIPGPGYGFSGFKAVEPVGRGTLIALVQPVSVDASRLAMVREETPKGFEPVNQPGAYLDQLVRHVTDASKSGAGLPDWAFALTEYEIVR